MTPEQHRRMMDIFELARYQPQPERDGFVRERCGTDSEMYTRLREMLDEHEQSGLLDHLPAPEVSPGSPVFSAGQLVAGRYRVIRFLSRGGMGEVYEAEDQEIRMRVALKTLLPQIAADGQMIARFKQEIQLSRQVSHENVCRVFDLARHQPEEPGRPPVLFFTMEFLSGETLAKRLENRRLACAEALPLLEQMAAALDAAHRAGVVHRDFKPSNVMLTPSGGGTRVVVTDFGVSRRLFPEADETRTTSGKAMGTFDYMAPELLMGAQASKASDVYALAVVAHRMVTGKMPARAVRPLPSPRLLVPDLDARWESAIVRGLDPAPEQRPASAGEFVKGLREETATLTIALPVMTRRRWAAAALAIVLLAGGWTAWRQVRAYHGQPSAEARRWYDLGAAALRDGTYYRAARALEQAIAAQPGFPLAYARLAEARYELDDSEKAKEEMLIALEAPYLRDAPHSVEALYVDAIHRFLVGDFAGAIRAYSELERRVPERDQSAVLVDLGRARLSHEEPVAALASYQAAIAKDPENAAAHLRAGILLGRQAHYPEAAAEFDRAASLYQAASNSEGQVEVLYQRALVLTQARRFAEARAALDQAISLARAISTESQEIACLLQQSVVTYLDGNPDEAERIATAATARARRAGMINLAARGLTDLGSAQLLRNDNGRAEGNFKEALDLARRYHALRYEARALMSLASVHQRKGDDDSALQEAKAALAFYSKAGFPVETRQALMLIARAYRDVGKEGEALNAFEQVLSKATEANDRVGMSQAQQGIASVKLHQGLWPEALERYQRSYDAAAAIGYRDGIIRAPLGRGGVLWRLGRYAEAEQALAEAEKAVAKSSAGGDIQKTAAAWRGDMALSRWQNPQAVTLAQRAIDLTPAGQAVPSMNDCVIGIALARMGSAAEGERRCRAAVAEAEKQKDADSLLQLHVMTAEVLLLSGHNPAALEQARAAAEENDSAGHVESAYRAWTIAAIAASRLRDPAAADITARATAHLAQLQTQWGQEYYRTYLTRPDIQRMQAELHKSDALPRKPLH